MVCVCLFVCWFGFRRVKGAARVSFCLLLLCFVFLIVFLKKPAFVFFLLLLLLHSPCQGQGQQPYSCTSASQRLHRVAQVVDVLVRVAELVKPEEAEAERLERLRLPHLQGHASGDLQALVLELAHQRRRPVADQHGRRAEALGRHALVAELRAHHRTHGVAQLLLRRLRLLVAEVLQLHHHVVEGAERLRRHRAVVHVAAVLVRLHQRRPRLQVQHERRALRAVQLRARVLAQHNEAGRRGARPALLRGRQQHVDAQRLHVHPQRAGRDAVQQEEGAHFVRGVGEGLDVRVRQHDARRRLDVRREDDARALGADAGHHLVDGRRREGRLGRVVDRAGVHDVDGRRDAARVEDLRPPEAEEAVADHERLLALRELARGGLHGVRAAARDDGHGGRVVGRLQRLGEALHDADEGGRHVVERAVAVHDGELLQLRVGRGGAGTPPEHGPGGGDPLHFSFFCFGCVEGGFKTNEVQIL
eukprot:Rhum_TRINITY_DN14870_c2_g1::Rhum_TRINITY_DN14870_c2_g1_i1::g.126196::m.126196